MGSPYALAYSLAAPVAAGLLLAAEAQAALLVAALREERKTGRPAPGTHRLLRFMFRQRLEQERTKRQVEAMHRHWRERRNDR